MLTRDARLWKKDIGSGFGQREKWGCDVSPAEPIRSPRVAILSEFPTLGWNIWASIPHPSQSLDAAALRRVWPWARRLCAAEADPGGPDSCGCLLTSHPTAGQLILPWTGAWVMHLCVCYRLTNSIKWEDNRPYSKELLWGLNEILCLSYSAQ